MDNEIGGLPKGWMDSSIRMSVNCCDGDSHFSLDPTELSTEKRFEPLSCPLTRRSGNTISLTQQGVQTATNKNTNTIGYTDPLKEPPVADNM
jgi:hypothetical protein